MPDAKVIVAHNLGESHEMAKSGRLDNFNIYIKLQVMIMGKSKKQYIGAIEDESEAALIYDWHAIVTQGIRVSY